MRGHEGTTGDSTGRQDVQAACMLPRKEPHIWPSPTGHCSLGNSCRIHGARGWELTRGGSHGEVIRHGKIVSLLLFKPPSVNL